VLFDTSWWIDHLRSEDEALARALTRGLVHMHPFVVGEIACGRVSNRRVVLESLQELPTTPVASAAEVLHLIESQELMGRGIGYVDAHLLASATLGGVRLSTRDKRLRSVAEEMGLA